MSQSLNLKEKSVVELKALAYDVSSLVNNYNQILQAVNQEITYRAEQEQSKTAKESKPESLPETKVVKLKKTGVVQES